MSVVFIVNLPVFVAPVKLRSTTISTTSPEMTSVSSFILTPMLLLNACVNASVLLISRLNTSLAEIIVKGTSAPSVCAIPMAIAVLPELGGPAIKTARPAILPSCTIRRITPAALRARICPTIPCDTEVLEAADNVASSRPSPRICEWAPIRSVLVTSRTDVFVVDIVPAACNATQTMSRLHVD